MRLSVIITCYNVHEVSVAHVRECMKSSYVPDEIVVVNDAGTPDLKDKLLELDINTRIVYARINEDIEWNYTGARNLGVWLSRGEYLCMEDNDNIPSPDVYRDGLQFLSDNPNVGRLVFGKRPVVKLEDLDKPMEEWTHYGRRPYHRDTQMLPRATYLTVKGCDERFAGKYAWACTDWRRRLNRAGIETGQIANPYYAVVDGETQGLIRRKSYTNYGYARERDGHTQPPIGMLNFSYTFEILCN